MNITFEPVSGGMVTARHPALLGPGEMPLAKNVMYMPTSDALVRQPGGQYWGIVASASEDVDGLTACKFDDGTHLLVAQASGKLWTADAETTGSTFASATINTTGLTDCEQLVSVEFDNRHYIFNGQNANRVLLDTGASRAHGLEPATVPLTYIGVTALPASVSATGYYEYWYTEVVKFADGQELESVYGAEGQASPLTVHVTSLSEAPILEFPSTFANQDAGSSRYYNIYRSEVKALQNDSLYPIGRKVGTASNIKSDGSTVEGRVRFTDTTTTSNTGAKVAGSNDTVMARDLTITLAGGAASASDAASAIDGKEIVFTRGTPSTFGPKNQGAITLHNFSLGSFSGNIVGVKVDVRIKASAADVADVFVGPGVRGSSNSLAGVPAAGGQPGFPAGIFGTGAPSISLNVVGGSIIARRRTVVDTSYTTYTFGGELDDFLPGGFSWKTQDISSAFAVQVGVVFNNKATGSETVSIDKVELTVFYAATNAASKPDQRLYDAIVVEESGVELKYGANGKPPTASVGCVFEGSLVTNDISQPSRIFYSRPGFPDAFPTSVYWIDMHSSDNDTITFLGAVNNRLVAGMAGSISRINYLPNEDDASFSRGRAIEKISDTVGIIKPCAACLFTNASGQQEFAFVDTNGVFATNAYSIRPLSTDLLWCGPASRNPVFGVNLGGSIADLVVGLYNDPRTQTLRLILNSGAMWIGSYASRHIRPDGSLKWTKASAALLVNAVSYAPTAACSFRRAGGAWVFARAYWAGAIQVSGGSVVREDSIDTATANNLLNADEQPTFRTRPLYLAGHGREYEIGAILLLGTDYGLAATANASLSATTTSTIYHTNATTEAGSYVLASASGAHLSEAGIEDLTCEAVDFSFAMTGTPQIEGVLVRHTTFEDSTLSA